MNKLAWKAMKTIKLGTGMKNADDFLMSLEESGAHVSDFATKIMQSPNFTVVEHEAEIDIVFITVAKLGITEKKVPREQVYAKAKELGLELCPNEVGPQLRLQYNDQPEHERLLIAMEGDEVFCLENNGCKPALKNWRARPDKWYKHYLCAFVLPRK